MIFIITAVYPEARSLIQRYGLNRNTAMPGLKAFSSDSITIVVGGIGRASVTFALGRLLQWCYEQNKEIDFILNFGCAGCYDQSIPIGRFFWVTRVMEVKSSASQSLSGTGLHCICPFDKVSVLSIDQPLSRKELENPGNQQIKLILQANTPGLVDMEAAGFLSPILRLIPPVKVGIIKVVTDHLDPPKTLTALKYAELHPLYCFLDSIIEGQSKIKPVFIQKPIINNNIRELSEYLISCWKLSAFQRQALEKKILSEVMINEVALKESIQALVNSPSDLKSKRNIRFREWLDKRSDL